MPVRDKVVQELASRLVGGFSFSFGEPRGMPKVQYELMIATIDSAYDHTMRTIDWNRVFWDAHSRHQALHSPDAEAVHEIANLKVPDEGSLQRAADGEDGWDDELAEDEPIDPLNSPRFFRDNDVCPECLMEAMLAQDFGGKSADKWAAKPKSLPWKFTNWRERYPQQRDAILAMMAERWSRPEPAPPEALEDDGHLPLCQEESTKKAGQREYAMRCDPRCPHYDGRLEKLTEATG